MAKRKVIVGSVLKRKDGSGNYIKIRGDHKLSDGLILNVESKDDQLASLESAIQAGKLSDEVADKVRARLDKWPDFVLFEITTYQN